MKVLFITHDGISHEPLGLEYLSASLLENSHRTKACTISQSEETIRTWRPQYVAFSVITGDQDRWGSVAQSIKKKFPQVQTIFGGPHFLYFKDMGMAGADHIIRGDGERAIVDCVEGRPYDQLQAIENLDDMPIPDRSLLYNVRFPAIQKNVIRNFISTRGCPYRCTYCFNSNTEWLKMVAGKKRLRFHSPRWVVDEIERTMRVWGGQLVSFQDDIFGADMAWLEDFVSEYQRVRYPFFAQLRPRLITEDRIKLLKEANIHILSFAIESGNECTRKEVLDRDEPNALIEQGCRILHRYGVRFRMQNMLGLPVKEPLQDALETLRLNMKCKPTLSWCSLLQAYPGTKIAERVVKDGLVKDQSELMNRVDATFFNQGSLPIKDKDKIERLHKYWSAVVRWPWIYPIVRMLINFDLGSAVHAWVFEKTKLFINKREYWRVAGAGEFKAREVKTTKEQHLDRLGGELTREPETVIGG